MSEMDQITLRVFAVSKDLRRSGNDARAQCSDGVLLGRNGTTGREDSIEDVEWTARTKKSAEHARRGPCANEPGSNVCSSHVSVARAIGEPRSFSHRRI